MGPAEGAAMLGEIWKIGDWSVFPAENTLRRDGSEVKPELRVTCSTFRIAAVVQKAGAIQNSADARQEYCS